MRIFSPGREGRTGVRFSCWAQLAILPRELNYNMDKFNLVVRAARELMRAVQENYYDLSDLNIINYSEVCEHNHVHSKGPRGHERPLARDTLQQEKWLCVYCEVRQETIFAQISKNILTWQQETINLNTCYSTGFNAIAITISAMAAEMLSIAFGLTTSKNKSIKCESFMICCRLNLSGSQENKLMNMQQE